MAVTATAAKVGRDLDEINLTVTGTLDTTVLSTDLTVVTPSAASISVDLSPENFTVPTTLPFTRVITPSLLGLTELSIVTGKQINTY